MTRALLISALLATTTPALAQFEGRCEPGEAASDYEFWEYIANNASRIADEYAMDRNPNATFAMADVDVVFQLSGEHEGTYLVILLNEAPNGISLATVKPNFDFCADPSSLDDSRDDLFEVVEAKFNGRPF